MAAAACESLGGVTAGWQDRVRRPLTKASQLHRYTMSIAGEEAKVVFDLTLHTANIVVSR